MKINGETRLLLVMGLFVLLGGGAMVWINRTPSLAPTPPPTPAPVDWTAERYTKLLAQARHSEGDAKAARVTLIEFGDLECPSCRRTYNSYLTKLRAEMPVRLIFFHFPLQQHKQALPAALATEAAGLQGKFWPMFDALYAGADTQITPELINQSAQKIGLDMTRFAHDSADPSLQALVQKDIQIATDSHVFQTPTFLVRDEKTGRIQQGVAAAGVDQAVSQLTGTPTLVPPSDGALPSTASTK